MRRRFVLYRQFFSTLLILSVSFTQAFPVWALRPNEPAKGTPANAGLEERLLSTAVPPVTEAVKAARLDQLVDYFSHQPSWIQVLEQSDETKADVLVNLFLTAIQGEQGTPDGISLALTDPGKFLPLALRLLTPGNPKLHNEIDAQWQSLQQECALCAAHIIHENLEETNRRDLGGHVLRDLLASIMTAFDAAKLGRIPTRTIKPSRGHTERDVVTQTAYSVSIVGGFQPLLVDRPENLIRALARISPRQPDERADSLPAVHVRALGSSKKTAGNHYVGIEAIDLGGDRLYILDNGETLILSVDQFRRQYNPTDLIFVTPNQGEVLDSAGFRFRAPSEGELLSWTGDCGTCAIKGDFPVGYHEPIEWALLSAGRLLYRGADGGTVQVRYRVGDGEPIIRSYRVAYNSTTQELTFRVDEIGVDQKESVFYEDTLLSMEATARFGYKPDKIKRFMALLLADLAHQEKFKIPRNAKIVDVVTHFRWATHSASDIKGTHPHKARPDEVKRPVLVRHTPIEPSPPAKTVTVAHNGIIYDFYELGIQLTDTGHTFETGVDSERFAHLVWEIIDRENPESLSEAVRQALGRIRLGDTYGFQIISNNFPGELVSARNESPIYLGIGEVSLQQGRPIPFFMTAADPKAILPHTGIYSASLLPNRTIVQVKNSEMKVMNVDGKRYFLVLPDGVISGGRRRDDGQLEPTPVSIQKIGQNGEAAEAPRRVTSLTKEEMSQSADGKLRLKIFASQDGNKWDKEAAGFIIFKQGKDRPEVYDLKGYSDYTTKELYQSGEGMRNTLKKNTVHVPVYYLPRNVPIREGPISAYRASDLLNKSNPLKLSLTVEQVSSITGPLEWTELIRLQDGRYVYVKMVPNVVTPFYDILEMPEFSGIPPSAWVRLREVDEVWGVSVGSSYNSDLDGFEFIRRHARLRAQPYNSDELRDDRYWVNDAAGKKRIAVIATTQSGTTAVTKADMEKIKNASGTPEAFGVEFITIADTNTPGSDITKSQYTELEMNEGLLPEIGVLSTEAVPAQKENKELFGMRLGIERRQMRPEMAHERIQELKKYADQVDEVLHDPQLETELKTVATELVRSNQAIAGYRGLSKGSAYEMNIKLEEGGEINTKPFNMGTFLHGPAQLLQFSKVPARGKATVEARYDPVLNQIISSVRYTVSHQGGEELRGFPIVVHYIPEEGDEGTRDRLESNFQTVRSRGASLFVLTSPDYARDLRQKKFDRQRRDGTRTSMPLVSQAIGVPANPYTLTSVGQKLALMVADIKNQQLADVLYDRARIVLQRQTDPLPADVSSREEWVRQALVDAYRQVEDLRANGWLSQIMHQEGLGLVLSRLNEAAQRPGEKVLVDEARDSLATLVNYIDVAQPGKLAKSVTVEARFDAATRKLLSSAGISENLLNTAMRGLLRIENGQIRSYKGILDLLSRLTGQSKGQLLRVALHHEGVERLLRLNGLGRLLRTALAQIPAEEQEAFRRRFREEFGEVDSYNWPFEVTAQYYTALFTDNVNRLSQLFGSVIGGAIERVASGVSLPEGIVETRNLHRLLVPESRATGELKDRQVRTLQQVKEAVRGLSEGREDLSVIFDGRLAEVEAVQRQLLTQVEQPTPLGVKAGLEEPAELKALEVNANVADTEIHYSQKPRHDTEDSRNDWQLLEPLRTELEKWGATVQVRYGDSLGRSPALEQATGSESRPFLQLSTRDQGRLTIAPAYRIHRPASTQRIFLVALLPDIRHSARYWSIPSDSDTVDRISLVYDQFVSEAGELPRASVLGQVRDMDSIARILRRAFERDGRDQIWIFETDDSRGKLTHIAFAGQDRPGILDMIIHTISINFGWNIWQIHAPKPIDTARGKTVVGRITVEIPLQQIDRVNLRDAILRNLEGGIVSPVGKDAEFIATPADLVSPAFEEIGAVAKQRGWEWDESLKLYRTPQGGWVSQESALGIHPSAVVSNGSLVRGASTRVEEDVKLTQSLVENAVIGKGAKLTGAIVRTDPATQDAWSWNGNYKVDKISQTVIGRDVLMDMAEDGEGTEIVNGVIGNRTAILGSSIRNSKIGSHNQIVRAKIGLTHTEDHVTIVAKNGAPIEVSESWLGWGRTIDAESYNEHLSPNLIRRAFVDPDGHVQFATVDDFPAVVIQGYSTIDASYDGTGKQGKELTSSRHGKGVKFPGSVMGPVTNAIFLVHPDFEDPSDLLRWESLDPTLKTIYAQLTALHPLSYSHRAEGNATGEVWGHIVPGASRFGLNTSDVSWLWVFEHARPAIQEILEEMHHQIDLHAKTADWNKPRREAAHRNVDNLPRYALETGKAIARLVSDPILEARYDQHLNVLGTNPEELQQYLAGGIGEENERLVLADLLKTEDSTQHDWNNHPLFTPEQRALLDHLPNEVEISPDSPMGDGAKVIGAHARLVGVTIPAGATIFVWGSYVEGGVLNNGDEVLGSFLRRVVLGQGVKLTGVQAEDAQLDQGVVARQAVVHGKSTIGTRTVLEPYARLENTTVGPDGSIGSMVSHSQFGRGITSHHLSRTRLDNVRTPDYSVDMEDAAGGKRTVFVANMSNISAGTVAQGTPEKPIKLHHTMLGANTSIPPGVIAGFLSFVKNAGQDTPPFAMSRGPGAGKITKGFTVQRLSSMAMRFLGKTPHETPEERAAINQLVDQELERAGLSDQRDGRWTLPLTGPLQSASDIGDRAKGHWEFRPKFVGDQGYGANPLYIWKSTVPQIRNLGELVTQLEGRYTQDGVIRFDSEYNSVKNRTTVAVVGPRGQVGQFLGALTLPSLMNRITDHGLHATDHVGISVVVVEGHLEKEDEQQIQERIEAIVPEDFPFAPPDFTEEERESVYRFYTNFQKRGGSVVGTIPDPFNPEEYSIIIVVVPADSPQFAQVLDLIQRELRQQNILFLEHAVDDKRYRKKGDPREAHILGITAKAPEEAGTLVTAVEQIEATLRQLETGLEEQTAKTPEAATVTTNPSAITQTLGEAVTPQELVSVFQAFHGIQFPPATVRNVATVVDLTVDERGWPTPASALLAPDLPPGTVAIVTSIDDLLTAEKMAGHPSQAKVITLDQVYGSLVIALADAIRQIPKEAESIQIFSSRPEPDVQIALAHLRDIPPVHFIAVSSLVQILEALGVDEATRTAFETLFQRVRDNWDGVSKYL